MTDRKDAPLSVRIKNFDSTQERLPVAAARLLLLEALPMVEHCEDLLAALHRPRTLHPPQRPIPPQIQVYTEGQTTPHSEEPQP